MKRQQEGREWALEQCGKWKLQLLPSLSSTFEKKSPETTLEK